MSLILQAFKNDYVPKSINRGLNQANAVNIARQFDPFFGPSIFDDDAFHVSLFSPFESSMKRSCAGGLANSLATASASSALSIDMRSDASKLYISADVPGITADQLSLEVDDEKKLLTISYSKKEKKEEKDEAGKVYKSERYSGSFSRQIALPKAANLQGASTSLENGVLQIEFPLIERKPNMPRKLSINGNSEVEAVADAPETSDVDDVVMNIDGKQTP